MQLRIRHTTGYRYETGAVASFNEARMTPLTTPDQMVLRSRLEITPTPWSSEYRDYWGSTVTAFEVNEPHTELTVVATSLVETSPAETVPERRPWESLEAVQDEWCEYLEISHWVAPSPALLAELTQLRADAATPTDYAEAVCAFLHESIRYVQGATEVTTAAADAWEAKSGVCQDFAHLTLGVLREARIPARYVSGYLHPSPEPVVGEEVTASHTRGSSGGTATGSASTPPTRDRSVSSTCSSPAGATTRMFRRCVASTPPGATPSCSSTSRSPACVRAHLPSPRGGG